MDAQRLAEVSTALGSPTRAGIVCALLSGRAHTGRELAHHLAVAPSTASEHLARLVDAGLVTADAQGRARYFRLAGPEVAGVVEGLLGAVRPAAPAPAPRVPAGLAFARTCYDHLAGRLGVQVCARLVELGALDVADDSVRVTADGRALLAGLGVDAATSGRGRPAVRLCLDWSERRHHLAGAVPAALLTRLLQQRWLARLADSRRELRLTRTGREGLVAHLGVHPGGTP